MTARAQDGRKVETARDGQLPPETGGNGQPTDGQTEAKYTADPPPLEIMAGQIDPGETERCHKKKEGLRHGSAQGH